MSSFNKINIMHSVLSLEVGGLEKIVCDIVLGLDKNIFNVEVCCFDTLGELAEGLMENNIKVNLLQRNQGHYDYFFPFKLRKLLREKNIHLLHMHSGTYFLGTQAGILARTPAMIYTDHGRHLVDPQILLYMDRFSSFFVDKIVTVSKELEEYLLNIVKLPHNKTTTIINGIDTNTYSFREKPVSLLKEFGISQNAKVIGTVGRLAEVKDQLSLIEAFSFVHRDVPDSILMLVGDGPMRSVLQQLVFDKGLNHKVIFTGSRMDVPDLLNLLDVFLLTSLSEGTSVSLLEAMASGIAPIVTNVGGNRSIVNDGLNGILIKPKDIAHMTDSITHLLNNEEARILIGQNAVNTVKQYFSKNKMLENYTDIYSNLCQSVER